MMHRCDVQDKQAIAQPITPSGEEEKRGETMSMSTSVRIAVMILIISAAAAAAASAASSHSATTEVEAVSLRRMQQLRSVARHLQGAIPTDATDDYKSDDDVSLPSLGLRL